MEDKYPPEKFEARAPDGHQKYIYLFARKSNLCLIFWAHKSTLVWLFKLIKTPLFFLFSDSRIVSHLPFTCNWQNRFWDSEPVIAHFPSNKGGNSDIQNPTQLFVVAPRPMYAWCVSCAWVGPEPYVETKFFVSYAFDSVNKAHKSKEGHL